MAYQQNTQAVAQRQPTDVAGVTGAETISPEIIALTQAFLMASPEITLPQAVKAAYFFHNTGQVEGRDSYIGTTGRVTGKVLEGYRGVARDAAERNVGEVQIKYRPLTADEATWNDVQPGDLARACEVYQLRAWRIAQTMGQPYEPIIGIGIVKPGEKVDRDGKPIPLIGGMTWGKKCQNRAYKDAMRHVPGMAINGAEVLEDAEERDIHVEVPQGAQLTREQAIALVAEAERLSIAPPQPMSTEQATATLAQNNARTRGTGPEWQGFGDDDERQPATTDASNGNGAKRDDESGLPFRNTPKDAVDWAMQHAPHVWPVDERGYIVRLVVERSFANCRKDSNLSGDALGHEWISKVNGKIADRAKAAIITDAELDGTDTDPVTAGDYEDAPQF